MDAKAFNSEHITRLKELLATSQKSMQLGTKYFEEANAVYSQCKSNCDKIDVAFNKLEQINFELNKQFMVCNM